MQTSTDRNAVPAGRTPDAPDAVPEDTGLIETAKAWIAEDPDDTTRRELARVIADLPGSAADLADRFAGRLTFGTAGLRGPVRAGPNGMNRAVVRATAAGLVAWLDAQGDPGPVVIGYDARHGSTAFAEETARVVTGAGGIALLLPRPLPTPVLAYAVTHLRADGSVVGSVEVDGTVLDGAPAAGVMVTASHNPPEDNGYKVYLGARLGGAQGAGAQIVPPADVEIEAAIRAVGSLREVPLGDAGTVLDDGIVDAYVRATAAIVDPDTPRELTIAYTPMHGVGAGVAAAAFEAAGFTSVSIVAAQAEPDPAFPTVAFPNPEEPGAMDLVMALGEQVGADIAIANDPDADRCAVAVPVAGGWRALRGDEVGVLLADHLMRRGVHGLYATTIVSSSLLRAVCERRDTPYAQTLTGFKWIVRAGTGEVPLAFGYEEALGYCVAPDAVRDKDGISAALLIAELAAGLHSELATLIDRLDELAMEYGLYATDQVSIRVQDLSEIGVLMKRLRAHPPTTLLDAPASVEDLLPASDVLIIRAAGARVVVRPSGTEPKLKAYLEVVEQVADGEVAAARERASASLTALRTETETALAIW